MRALAAFLVAAVVSLALQPLVIRVLRAREILDVPGERSSHRHTTPRGGGLAVVAGVVAGLVLLVHPAAVLILSVIAFAGLGAIDDVKSLPSGLRLAAQLGIAASAAFAVVPRLDVPAAGLVGGLVIAGWLILYVNTFNFMDGVNGISALQGIVMGGALAACGLAVNSDLVTSWAAVIAGSALAFLPFNARTARVFLGDVGSYGLGAAIALLGIVAISEGVPVWVVACLPAIYLGDVLLTLVKRLAGRRPLLSAHREHIYQQLVPTGRSHVPVAALVTLMSAATAACVILLWLSEDGLVRSVLLTLGVSLTAGYLAAPLIARTPREPLVRPVPVPAAVPSRITRRRRRAAGAAQRQGKS